MDYPIAHGHMLQEYYVRRVRELSLLRKQKRDAIKTHEQAKSHILAVRKKIKSIFGPFPARTPLNPKITGEVECDTYVIKKIIIESRPQFPVTINLYVPKNLRKKAPAVLAPCGHYTEGKAGPTYQNFCIGLVNLGYIVLIYDPIGQGERHQFAGFDGITLKDATAEHNQIGKQMYLTNEFFGTWRVWDGIRCLDYLLSIPEVDSTRVGVTGNSGGGTLTTYLTALDPRFTMAAPGCFVTTYTRNIENEEAQDCEQCPPDFLRHGLEVSDFLIAYAPRPVLLLSQQNDFFDPRGVVENYSEIKRIYRLLGYEKNVALFIGPDGHGYFQKNREAMYKFFNRFAKLTPPPAEEPPSTPAAQETLFCTKSGEVCTETPKPKRIHDYLQHIVLETVKKRKKTLSKETLLRLIPSVLHIPKVSAIPYHRHLKWREVPNFRKVGRAAIETENSIQAFLYMPHKIKIFYHIPKGNIARLHIPHLSSFLELRDGLVTLDETCDQNFLLDVRGSGESTALSVFERDYFDGYDADYFYATTEIMLGECYLGKKVFDVLSAIAVLKGEGYSSIQLSGRGLGSIVAALAGLCSPLVTHVTLKNYLPSWQSLVEHICPSWPLSHLPRGVLAYFDLPDVYTHLAKKNLSLIEPWDAAMGAQKKAI